jgi:hypothetical protein
MNRRMSREQLSSSRVLKTTIVFVLPSTEATKTVVIGCQDPVVDVDAVQAAVDHGGSVLLQGTFDFGDDGRVLLRKDVAISGEADASGNSITTIIGGDCPFFAPAPRDILPIRPGPMISVEGIHFSQPSSAAIHLVYTGGVYIRGNKVTEIRRRPLSASIRNVGVLIGPSNSLVTDTSFSRLVTGSIVVVENQVQLTATDPSDIGVFVHPTDSADVYITRNLTTNCMSDCVDWSGHEPRS